MISCANSLRSTTTRYRAPTVINDRGKVVGILGICDNAVGRFSAAHAVMWNKRKTIDFGNLGGASWHTPMAINPPSGAAIMHAFLWTGHGGIKDLGTLDGDFFS